MSYYVLLNNVTISTEIETNVDIFSDHQVSYGLIT